MSEISYRSTNGEANELAPVFAIAAQVNKLARTSAENQLAAASLAPRWLLVDDDPECELALIAPRRLRNSNAERVAIFGSLPSRTDGARSLPAVDATGAHRARILGRDLGHEHPGGGTQRVDDVQLDAIAVDVR